MSFIHKFDAPILLRVSGRDSLRYLNARLSNKIRDIQVGSGCAAAALSAQGRTEGFFSVLRIAESTFILSCDGGIRSEVIAAFKRYIVADRVEVEDLSESHNLGHWWGEPENSPEICRGLADPEFSAGERQGAVLFRHTRLGQPGWDIIAPREAWSQLTSGFEDVLSADFRTLRIVAGAPSFPEEINSESIFLESGLLSAVSFTKGCYVGQEVLERVDSHGRLPRRLVHGYLAVKTPPQPETSVDRTRSGEPKPFGRIISSAHDPKTGRSYCFAEIKSEPISPEDLLTVEGYPFTLSE